MKCEEVRELLPAYIDRDLHPVGPVETHLASCNECAAELSQYRDLIGSLAVLRETGEEPRAEYLGRMLSLIPPSVRAGMDRRARYALASLGGAAIGVTAVAILWWRLARRATQPESPEVA
ncbi:MAG: zf-HC2 domain-containing protein [Actinomycetota bacterium]